MLMNGNEEFARKVRAARELAGLRSAEALAEAIDEAGLGVRTIRAIEQGRRYVQASELTAIARACGVSVDFFRADLSTGPPPAQPAAPKSQDVRMENAESQLASIWQSLTQLRDDLSRLRVELGSVRSQTDALSEESMTRRTRTDVERESTRRGNERGTSDAQDDPEAAP